MAYQFNGFRATKPVDRLIDAARSIYEVFFIVYDNDNKKYFRRYKKGINNCKKSERKRQAKALAEVLWEEIRYNNWNPLLHRIPSCKQKDAGEKMNLAAGLKLAVEIKRKVLSKYSMYDYDACVRYIEAAASTLGIKFLLIKELKRRDVIAIIRQAKEKHKWSSKARNKYLSIFRSLLSALVEVEEHVILEANPAFGIKDEPEEEGFGYKRLTDQEKNKVAGHLLLKAPDFFEYLMFIYDDGIRRKETLLLRIADFNLATKEIRIRPEVAKTNTARVVPITDTILQILLRREVWKYPPDYYLFSNQKFLPGPVAYHPNTPTNWWRQLVIEDPELGIDCKMYSLKHKGADDKIEAGIPLEVLQTLYGHKSKQMTEIYARAIKGKYKQQIIDHAPAFAKIIEMKRSAR